MVADLRNQENSVIGQPIQPFPFESHYPCGQLPSRLFVVCIHYVIEVPGIEMQVVLVRVMAHPDDLPAQSKRESGLEVNTLFLLGEIGDTIPISSSRRYGTLPSYVPRFLEMRHKKAWSSVDSGQVGQALLQLPRKIKVATPSVHDRVSRRYLLLSTFPLLASTKAR
jgi:hypothetical protein